MSNNPEIEKRDFDELRQLLLGSELKKLQQLSERLESPEKFSNEVGEILPQAMIKSAQRDGQLAEAMVPTVEKIVRLSIKRDINKFADALFPVIGPAIRKSISETFRQMVQSLNQTIEQSFSWQGIKWRIESSRTGIPVAQIVLLHSLIYRVEQVFLIHRKTGLLLHHLEAEDGQNQDPDMVSSMLSAVSEFASDSFKVEKGQALGGIQVGELSIWIEQGPEAVLALAVRGEAPHSLRTELQQTLEQIHAQYAQDLETFSGEIAAFESSQDLLSNCLQAQSQVDQDKKSSSKALWLASLISGLLLYWISSGIYSSMLQNDYIALLDSEPGYVITEVSDESDQLVIRGLREPLSRSPETLIALSELDPAKVSHRFEPYQSLTNEFVRQRVMNILSPPDNVSVSLEGTSLTVKGLASEEWLNFLLLKAPLIAGIDRVDSSGIKHTMDFSELEAPESVELSMDINNRHLVVNGRADNDWILSLESATEKYEEIEKVDFSQLTNITEEQLITDIRALEQKRVIFGVASSFNLGSDDSLNEIVSLIKNIIKNANDLSRNAQIIVRGHSDSLGNFEDNVVLSFERADFVAQKLLIAGIAPKYILIKGLEAPVKNESSDAEKRNNRRVDFEGIFN